MSFVFCACHFVFCLLIRLVGSFVRAKMSMSEYSETDETGPPIQLEPGSIVQAKWTVMKSLGEGGCGVVYEV